MAMYNNKIKLIIYSLQLYIRFLKDLNIQIKIYNTKYRKTDQNFTMFKSNVKCLRKKFEIFLEYFKISLMIDYLECLVLSTYFEGVYFQPKVILLEKWI